MRASVLESAQSEMSARDIIKPNELEQDKQNREQPLQPERLCKSWPAEQHFRVRAKFLKL